MILQFQAVPNSSVIAEEIERYPSVAIDQDVLLNLGRYHFRLLGPSRRSEAVLDLCQEVVEDLSGKNNEHRMAQLKWEVRETVSRLQKVAAVAPGLDSETGESTNLNPPSVTLTPILAPNAPTA